MNSIVECNNHTKTIKDKQTELQFCILKGCCPHCLSKKIVYREFIANRRFGFNCNSCGWQGYFSIKELIEFSNRWI